MTRPAGTAPGRPGALCPERPDISQPNRAHRAAGRLGRAPRPRSAPQAD